MIKILSLSFILFLLTVVNIAPAASAGEPAPDKVVIAQFGQERFLLYLPLYVAIEEGVFAKHGLDVTLKFAGNDDQIFATVISGGAQFGVGDPVFAAISHDKGGPGKVVAMMVTSLGMVGVTNEDKVHTIADPKELNGLRISSLPEPSTTFTLLSEIKRDQGLNAMTIVQAAFGAQMALLEAGKVDIATDLEPSVSIYEAKGYRRVIDLTPWMPRQAITGITTTEEVIKSRPATVQKMVDGLQEAVNLMYSDPEISYRVAKKIYPNQPDAVIRKAVDSVLGHKIYPTSIAVADDLWQRTLKTRLDSGELKRGQTTDIAVDNHFAERAKADVGVPKE